MPMTKQEQEWQQTFSSIVDRFSNNLLNEAKQNSERYRDASKYIKRIGQQSFGDITDPVDRAARTINGAICELALYKLHEEERDLPIKRGEDND